MATLLLLSALLLSTQAQTTAPFTDPVTGITFQRFFGARTTFSFGIALPENPSTDFIGQIECPIPNSAGWGAISMGGDMDGPLLLAAWPNAAGDIVSSFRIAKNEEDSPPPVTGAFALAPIAAGTLRNATHMRFTFLCTNCISAQNGFSAADTGGTVEMGWALSKLPVSNPEDPAAVLGFHDVGFGSFDAQLSLARSPLFGEWSLLAGSASNGSTAPVPVSAANPVTGGGNDNDDDDGDDIDDDNDVDDGIDDDIDDDDNDDNDGGIAFGSGTGKAAGAGGAAVASKGNKKKSNKVDN